MVGPKKETVNPRQAQPLLGADTLKSSNYALLKCCCVADLALKISGNTVGMGAVAIRALDKEHRELQENRADFT